MDASQCIENDYSLINFDFPRANQINSDSVQGAIRISYSGSTVDHNLCQSTHIGFFPSYVLTVDDYNVAEVFHADVFQMDGPRLGETRLLLAKASLHAELSDIEYLDHQMA